MELEVGGNKEGIEKREMKGCVGGRRVGVKREKRMATSPVNPLAPHRITIKTSFHSFTHSTSHLWLMKTLLQIDL